MRKGCLIIVVQILVMVELTGPPVLPIPSAQLFFFFSIALTTIGHLLCHLVSFLPLLHTPPPNIHTIEYQLHRAEILSLLFTGSKHLEQCEQRRCSSTVKWISAP